MKSSRQILTVIVILFAIVLGFAGGYYFRNSQLQKNRGNFTFGNGNQFQRFMGNRSSAANGGGMMGRGGVFGSIIATDDKSITVKLADGSSKIVLFSDATSYTNTVSAAKNDLKIGENVAVFGAANTDGSVTAANVQLNPEFSRFQPSPSANPK